MGKKKRGTKKKLTKDLNLVAIGIQAMVNLIVGILVNVITYYIVNH